jgi:hypothetical protein
MACAVALPDGSTPQTIINAPQGVAETSLQSKAMGAEGPATAITIDWIIRSFICRLARACGQCPMCS